MNCLGEGRGMSLYIIENGSRWLYAPCTLLSLCLSFITSHYSHDCHNSHLWYQFGACFLVIWFSCRCGSVQSSAALEIDMQSKCNWKHGRKFLFFSVESFCFHYLYCSLLFSNWSFHWWMGVAKCFELGIIKCKHTITQHKTHFPYSIWNSWYLLSNARTEGEIDIYRPSLSTSAFHDLRF